MPAKKKAAAPKAVTVVAFKGFDSGLKCRDMQYVIGVTAEHAGSVEACRSGLHACEYPLDVFSYYPPSGENGVMNRFAMVEASGEIARHDGDSKLAAARLTVKAELKIPDLVAYAVRWVLDHVDKTKEQTNTGYQSAASNTGDYSAASNTGDYSAASNTGARSAASNTGADSVAMASGYQGKAMACAGSAIVLCYRDDDRKLIHIRAGIAGKDVKADTWYSLNDQGEFVEAK